MSKCECGATFVGVGSGCNSCQSRKDAEAVWEEPVAVREATPLDSQFASIDVESMLSNARVAQQEAKLALVEADRRLDVVTRLAHEVGLARKGTADLSPHQTHSYFGRAVEALRS